MSDELRCLECKQALTPRRNNDVQLCRCDQCGGAWMIESELMAALARAGDSSELRIEPVEQDSPRHCPSCQNPLGIAWIGLLQLDRCAEHGLWFDGGELEKALGDSFGDAELGEASTPRKRIDPSTWAAIFDRHKK